MSEYSFAVKDAPDALIAEDHSFVILQFQLQDGSGSVHLKLDRLSLQLSAIRLGEMSKHVDSQTKLAQGHVTIHATTVQAATADVPAGEAGTVLSLQTDNGTAAAYMLPLPLSQLLAQRLQEILPQAERNAAKTLQ